MNFVLALAATSATLNFGSPVSRTLAIDLTNGGEIKCERRADSKDWLLGARKKSAEGDPEGFSIWIPRTTNLNSSFHPERVFVKTSGARWFTEYCIVDSKISGDQLQIKMVCPAVTDLMTDKSVKVVAELTCSTKNL